VEPRATHNYSRFRPLLKILKGIGTFSRNTENSHLASERRGIVEHEPLGDHFSFVRLPIRAQHLKPRVANRLRTLRTRVAD